MVEFNVHAKSANLRAPRKLSNSVHTNPTPLVSGNRSKYCLPSSFLSNGVNPPTALGTQKSIFSTSTLIPLTKSVSPSFRRPPTTTSVILDTEVNKFSKHSPVKHRSMFVAEPSPYELFVSTSAKADIKSLATTKDKTNLSTISSRIFMFNLPYLMLVTLGTMYDIGLPNTTMPLRISIARITTLSPSAPTFPCDPAIRNSSDVETDRKSTRLNSVT